MKYLFDVSEFKKELIALIDKYKGCGITLSIDDIVQERNGDQGQFVSVEFFVYKNELFDKYQEL
jgi:hypothetical protein